MTARIVVGCLLVWLAGCAAVPSVPATRIPLRISLGDKEIRTATGAFMFSDVILTESRVPGSWIITGMVRNNTGRDWSQVVFDFQLYDMTKSVLSNYIESPIRVNVHALRYGEEARFGALFKPLRQDALQSIRSYEVTHKTPQIFVMVKPWESRELLFEDQVMHIRFTLSEKQIGIKLQNKTSSPMRIDWDTISYVDITGLAHRVTHTGVRYIERDQPQVPTLIPPVAMIEDAIVPVDHISYTPGSGSGWSSRPLFPGLTETELYIGKSFSVFMPLEIDGAVKNYLFAFSIEREAP